jgi:hypothetical protein
MLHFNKVYNEYYDIISESTIIGSISKCKGKWTSFTYGYRITFDELEMIYRFMKGLD